MSNKAVRHRKKTTNQLGQYIPPKGDLIVDETKPTVVVGDGLTPGGIPLAQQTHIHSNATTNTAGFMSASDKTKLDAISESGAITNIQTDEITVAPARSTINFNTDFSLSDNSENESTDFAISAAFRTEMQNQALLLALMLS